ncbi:hypothetical protein ANN_21800, partial [Periplaneta americana]
LIANHILIGVSATGPKTKIQIYNSIIKPIIQYSTESLPLLDKHRSKLTAVEMKYLRRTVGKTRRDRIRNDRIREEVKMRKVLTEVINERQLKWFGHVYRMGEERKVKQVMEMRVEGRRRRGRPRIKWEDTIERIGQQKGKTMVEMKRMCRDREKMDEMDGERRTRRLAAVGTEEEEEEEDRRRRRRKTLCNICLVLQWRLTRKHRYVCSGLQTAFTRSRSFLLPVPSQVDTWRKSDPVAAPRLLEKKMTGRSHLNAIDLTRDRTRNLGHRRPALYQLANQFDHNTELHALYSSPDIIRNIKSKRLRWAGYVARMGESRNAYRVLVGRPRRRWEDNIKMNLREVGYDDREWINLAQDRDQWRAYVRTAMNLRVP